MIWRSTSRSSGLGSSCFEGRLFSFILSGDVGVPSSSTGSLLTGGAETVSSGLEAVTGDTASCAILNKAPTGMMRSVVQAVECVQWDWKRRQTYLSLTESLGEIKSAFESDLIIREHIQAAREVAELHETNSCLVVHSKLAPPPPRGRKSKQFAAKSGRRN